MTTIISNGNKWGGQQPDSVADLLQVLGETPLDRSFENYGNFIQQEKLETVFFGNFLHVSHVFNIVSDDDTVVQSLTNAIQANQKRPDYLSQPKPKMTPPYFTTATPTRKAALAAVQSEEVGK